MANLCSLADCLHWDVAGSCRSSILLGWCHFAGFSRFVWYPAAWCTVKRVLDCFGWFMLCGFFSPFFCIFVGFVSPQYVLTPKLEFLIPSSSTHNAKTGRLYGKGNSKSERDPILVVALLKLIMAGKYE